MNLSDDETREMTTAQIVAGWKNGSVTSEAYVWKDGLADWTPLLEVPELRAKLGPAPVSGRPSTPGKSAMSGGRTSVVRPSHSRMNDMFGGFDVNDDAETVPLPPVAAAAPPKNPAPQKNPAPPKNDDKAVGERNESSVLFSLDALKGKMESNDSQPQAPDAADLFGLGGGDGLGDLGGGGLGGGGLGGGPVLGGLGSLGAPLGNNAADLLTAPVQEPPKLRPQPLSSPTRGQTADGKKKKTLLIGAVVGLLALGGVAFALSGSSDEAAEVVAENATPSAEDEEKKRMAEQLAAAEAEKQKMAEQLAAAEAEKKRLAEEEAKKAEEEARKKEEEEKEKAEEEAKAKAEAEKTVAAKGSTTKSASPTTSSGGGGAFNKDAARAALATAASRAASCKKPNGPTGPGKAVVTFAPSGNATSAVVQGGAYGGTSVGGCIASTFRKAKVPPFSGASVTVSKSFRL